MRNQREDYQNCSVQCIEIVNYGQGLFLSYMCFLNVFLTYSAVGLCFLGLLFWCFVLFLGCCESYFSSRAIDCVERLVCEVTYNVSSGTLNYLTADHTAC